MASHKLLALEGPLSAKDRPKAKAQTLPKQQVSDHIDPEELVGKLCVGKRACLLPTLLHYIKQQIQQLDEVDEEEPLPGGKFHMPPFSGKCHPLERFHWNDWRKIANYRLSPF